MAEEFRSWDKMLPVLCVCWGSGTRLPCLALRVSQGGCRGLRQAAGPILCPLERSPGLGQAWGMGRWQPVTCQTDRGARALGHGSTSCFPSSPRPGEKSSLETKPTAQPFPAADSGGGGGGAPLLSCQPFTTCLVLHVSFNPSSIQNKDSRCHSIKEKCFIYRRTMWFNFVCVPITVTLYVYIYRYNPHFHSRHVSIINCVTK